jgi:hypothetical protein
MLDAINWKFEDPPLLDLFVNGVLDKRNVVTCLLVIVVCNHFFVLKLALDWIRGFRKIDGDTIGEVSADCWP